MGSLANHIQQALWASPEDPADSPAHRIELKPPDPLDPRPDLAEDAELWAKLLEIAFAENYELAYTLHGFRCYGTRIKKINDRYVLRPDIDSEGLSAWPSQKEYEEAREKWLRPHVNEIAEWLQRL